VKWPQVRAGLIACAIAIGAIEGCPIQSDKDTPRWEKPVVDVLRSARAVALRPFTWLGDGLHVTQRFAMFEALSTDRYRIIVETQDQAHAWHLIYRIGDDDHAAYRDVIDYRRMRGTYDPVEAPSGRYRTFVGWLAARIFADDAAAVAVRVRFENIHLAPGVVTPTGASSFPVVVVRR
jgi:hypothetical protein